MSNSSSSSLSSVLLASGLVALGMGTFVLYQDYQRRKRSSNRLMLRLNDANSSIADSDDEGMENLPEDFESQPIIYFGSQTGTAENFAKDIQRALGDKGIASEVVDLEDFTPSEFETQRLVILCLATFGEGDPTDNALRFSKWLTSKKTKADLSSQRFAVFGLGNRQYMNYNEMGRRADKNLTRFGSTRICERGEGDDDQDIEQDFSEWLNKHLVPAICNLFPRTVRAATLAARTPTHQGSPTMLRQAESMLPGAFETSPTVRRNRTGLANHNPTTSKFLDPSSARKQPGVISPITATINSSAFSALEAQIDNPFFTDCFLSAEPAVAAIQTRRCPLRVVTISSMDALPNLLKQVECQAPTNMPGTDLQARAYLSSVDASVVENRSLKKDQATYHIELALPSPGLYATADNCDFFPGNPSSEVEYWLKKLNISSTNASDLVVFLEGPRLSRNRIGDSGAASNKHPFPSQTTTVRDALTFYCDLTSVPTRNLLKDLAEFLTDAAERSALSIFLNSPDAAALYKQFVKDPQLTLADFIDVYATSLKISFGDFVQLCPRQRPRPYTISSSSVVDPSIVAMTIAKVVDVVPALDIAALQQKNFAPLADNATFVLAKDARRKQTVASYTSHIVDEEERTKQGDITQFRGLTSHWGALLKEGAKCKVLFKPTHFKLPEDQTIPVIMIGAGTGIAPFRALVQELRHVPQRSGDTVLFFGCRSSTEDFLYKEELEAAVDEKKLTKLIMAFSREQEHKVYVQNQVANNSDYIGDLIKNKKALVLVCGSMRMGESIRTEIFKAVHKNDAHVNTDSMQEQSAFLEQLKQNNQLYEELWA